MHGMTTSDSEVDHTGVAGRAHADLRLQLPDYATAEACGQAVKRLSPTVRAHLDHCPTCRDTLHDLLELTAAAYEGAVDAAPSYPPVDLSFLHRGGPSSSDPG